MTSDIFTYDRNGALLETHLPGALERRQGKVRDVYVFPDGILLLATDRISAFDVVMSNGIPDKGKILTGISNFWFDQTVHIIGNHLISTDVNDFPAAVRPYSNLMAGRTMWCEKLQVVPIECVVRNYLTGSGWESYLENGSVCGNVLAPGLVECQKLPELLFTPTTKEESGHDKPVNMAGVTSRVGAELATVLRATSLEVFRCCADLAATRGFLLVDTKFEFGLTDSGWLLLADELLTPDSSRYWDASKYAPGRPNEAFDKQFVRDYLKGEIAAGRWNKEAPGPELPQDVVAETRRVYRNCYQRITGIESD